MTIGKERIPRLTRIISTLPIAFVYLCEEIFRYFQNTKNCVFYFYLIYDRVYHDCEMIKYNFSMFQEYLRILLYRPLIGYVLFLYWFL